jgi:hypothetical protein
MPDTRLALTSFQDGRAVVEIAYDERRARLELDLLEDLYPGQPTAERVRQELDRLTSALNTWLKNPESTIQSP